MLLTMPASRDLLNRTVVQAGIARDLRRYTEGKMYEATPEIFKIKEAARLAARAYTLEEDSEWIVVFKEYGNTGNIYKPCLRSDLKNAKEEGWTIV